ncbi:putative quinol monooxygenase [Heyndrickxia acidicola]|jgi:quinol monooxygenase YgiN|uniref:Quinol monooxygenase n=1 Tax=Heyndrickxia acidicola TaxID=209389 RepID=A0ABU6MJZ7_9BACI|nr:putative quinol monooxygenase [Heyndrickxia acidicola]MED1204678.1 putative quinol monooxygenase [Heyndrickxia acidicola]
MIMVHGLIKVNPEYRAAFLEIAGRAVEQSRAEEGNAEYRLFEEVDQPNVFLTLEQWVDQTALESHKKGSHFNEFVKSIEGFLIEPPEIQVIPMQNSGI